MEQTADIALIGLAVMGQNLILNMNDHGYTVVAFNRTVSKVDEFLNDAAKGRKTIIGAHSIEEMVGLLKRPRKIMLMVKAGKAVDDFIGTAAALPGAGRPDYRWRQLAFPRHHPAHEGPGEQGPAVHRNGRFGRRGRRALRPLDDAGRQSPGLAAGEGYFPGHLRQDARGRALLRLDGRGWRRPFRQDGPQRHRIRRHAAHLRSLPAPQGRPGHGQRGDAQGVRRVEPRRPGQLPDPDHARHSGLQGRERRVRGGPDPRYGRPEGHRQVDQRLLARPGHARDADRRSGVRALPERHEGRPRGRVQDSERPEVPVRGRSQGLRGRHPARAAGVQDRLLRAGFHAVARGGQGIPLEPQLRRHRHGVARRVHHSLGVSGQDQRGVRPRSQFEQPAAGRVFPGRDRALPALLEARGGHRP